MRKNLLAVTSLIFSMATTMAQPIYYQYFDGADTSASNSVIVTIPPSLGNIWQIGPPQKTIFNSASTTPNVMITDTINMYPVSNTSSFSFKIFPDPWWGGPMIIAVQWKQKLDMQQFQGDGGIVETSINHSPWENVINSPWSYNLYGYDPANVDTLSSGEAAFSGTDTTWRDIWFCHYGGVMSSTDTMEIRFTFKSDSIPNTKEGWMIDDLSTHITFGHTIKEIEQKEYLMAFPSPTNGIVNLQLEKMNSLHMIEHMELRDAKGTLVKSWGKCPPRYFIDLRDVADGIYFLVVTTNIKTDTKKIILKKDKN